MARSQGDYDCSDRLVCSWSVCLGMLVLVVNACLVGASVYTIGRGALEFAWNKEVLSHVSNWTTEADCDQLNLTGPVHASCSLTGQYDFARDFSQNALYDAISKFYDPSVLVGACLDFYIKVWQSPRRQLYDPPKDGGLTFVEWRDATAWQLLPTFPAECSPGAAAVPEALRGRLLAKDDAVTIGAYGIASELLAGLPTEFVDVKDAGNFSIEVDGLTGTRHMWARSGYLFLTAEPPAEPRRLVCGDLSISLKPCSTSKILSAVAMVQPPVSATPGIAATLGTWHTGLRGNEANVAWLSNGDHSLNSLLTAKVAESLQSAKESWWSATKLMIIPMFFIVMVITCNGCGFICPSPNPNDPYRFTRDTEPGCCEAMMIAAATCAAVLLAGVVCAVLAVFMFLLALYPVAAALLLVAIVLCICVPRYFAQQKKEDHEDASSISDDSKFGDDSSSE